MKTVRTKSLLAVCLALAAIAAGCASDPTTAPTTTLSEEDRAVVDAEATFREWNRVWDSCMEDPPNTVSSCFNNVAVGDQLISDYASLSRFQQEGVHSIGESRIVSIALVSVDLTDRVERPADPDNGIPEVRTVPKVVFDVCTDLTGTDLINAAGESQVPPDRPKYRRTLVEVVNYLYPESTQWRVWNAYKDAETPTCEP